MQAVQVFRYKLHLPIEIKQECKFFFIARTNISDSLLKYYLHHCCIKDNNNHKYSLI